MKTVWHSSGGSLSPLTFGLLTYLLCGVFLGNLLLSQIGLTQWDQTPVARAGSFFTPWWPQRHNDSWRFMIRAYEEFKYPQPRPLYPTIFFSEGNKFQYPPTSLLLIDTALLLDRLVQGRGSVPELVGFLNGISWVSAVVLIYCTVWIISSRARNSCQAGVDRLAQGLAVAMLVLTYHPFVDGYGLGQVQVLIDALFAATVCAWLAGRFVAAGFLLGLISLIKPHYVLLLVWGLLRRHHRFTLAFAFTLSAGTILSVALFGLQNHLDYMDVLAFIGARGEAYYSNQTINGLLNRLRRPADPSILQFSLHGFPPFDPVVCWGTFLGGLALMLPALAWRAPAKDPNGSIVEFAVLAVVATITSPIAWHHQYGVLIPIYALLCSRGARTRASRTWSVAVAASVLLTGVDWEPLVPLLNQLFLGIPHNLIQSRTLFGASILLICLVASRPKESPVVPAEGFWQGPTRSDGLVTIGPQIAGQAHSSLVSVLAAIVLLPSILTLSGCVKDRRSTRALLTDAEHALGTGNLPRAETELRATVDRLEPWRCFSPETRQRRLAEAYAGLARVEIARSERQEVEGSSQDVDRSLRAAARLLDRAIDLNGRDPQAQLALQSLRQPQPARQRALRYFSDLRVAAELRKAAIAMEILYAFNEDTYEGARIAILPNFGYRPPPTMHLAVVYADTNAFTLRARPANGDGPSWIFDSTTNQVYPDPSL